MTDPTWRDFAHVGIILNNVVDHVEELGFTARIRLGLVPSATFTDKKGLVLGLLEGYASEDPGEIGFDFKSPDKIIRFKETHQSGSPYFNKARQRFSEFICGLVEDALFGKYPPS